MNDWEKKPLLRPSEEGQSPIRLSILGDFVLSNADGRQFPIATKKNRALLAVLALSAGSQATRERLCGLLWGDRGEDQARSSLRQSLAVLRKELGQIEELVLKTHDDIVALRRDTVQIDAVEFLALSHDSGITTLREAAKLYRGELLGDTSIRDAAFEDWLSAERSRLKTVAIKIFDRLVPLEEGHSRIVAAQQLVSFDPLRESSHRLLMQAYADQGDNGLALKQFELCRKLLHEELSVEPARETLELRRQIAEGDKKSTTREDVLVKINQPSQAEQLPSIAVLPFANLSDNPSEDYFCDGITLSIISSLGRYHEFFVIDSNSSYAYRDKATKPFDAARELSVRYILEGSVQKSADHVRVSVQLVEGATGQQLWSQVYDRQIKTIFSVQDEITESIIGALGAGYGGRLRKAWRERKRPIGIETFVAMDYFHQAMDQWDFTKQGMIRARELLHKAIESDPGFAKAYSKISWSYMVDAYCGLTDNYDNAMENGRKFAIEGLARDESDSWARWALAGYHMYKLNHGIALEEFQKAVDFNPSDAEVLTDYGLCLSYAGRAEEGIEQALKAIRLNPHHADWYTSQLGQLYFDAKQYGKTIATFASLRWLDSALMRVYQAASFAMLGRMDDATASVRRAIELDPEASIEKWGDIRLAPYSDAGYLGHFRSALRKAGLPEVRRVNSLVQSTRPSIAVLPFANLSGDTQQDYLADGLAEDVIAGLSRFSTLIVISRNSSFQFRGSSTDAKTVGQELGVQYLVAGSLRRVGQLIRVSAQLIDTASGVQLWSEKYERKPEELLDVQDDMVHAIVTTFEHRIADIRASEISHQPTSNWAAYDYFLKARQLMSHYSNYAAAEEPLRRAIELDPSFSEAHARLAHVAMSKYWASGHRVHIEEASRHAKTAIRLDDRNSAAHTAMSLVSAFMNNYDLAFLHADRALELNPNNTQAAKNRAMWQVFVGKSAEALAAFDTILMRDPYPTANSWEIKGAALFQLHRYEEAIKIFAMIPELQYWDRAYLIACHVRLGNTTDAKNEVSALLQLHPEFSISRVFQTENYVDEDSREHLRNALLEAGLPENTDSIDVEAGQ